ncbi:hypothetical protein AAVH_01761 [Aphelenchoides avenae]|nr:hypothetical protein AAVH_01761 [Aphelenchus avenae]
MTVGIHITSTHTTMMVTGATMRTRGVDMELITVGRMTRGMEVMQRMPQELTTVMSLIRAIVAGLMEVTTCTIMMPTVIIITLLRVLQRLLKVDAEGAKRYSYFTQGNGPDGFYSKGYFGSEGYEHELAKAREEEDAHGDGYKKLEHHTDSAEAHGGHGHDHASAEHGHYDAGHKHHGADHSEHGGSHEHSEDGWRKGHDKDEWQSGAHH